MTLTQLPLEYEMELESRQHRNGNKVPPAETSKGNFNLEFWPYVKKTHYLSAISRTVI